LLALFDPGFDSLSAVILSEPAGKIFSDPVNAKVKQGTVRERLAGIGML
jgi:hypothetical protein